MAITRRATTADLPFMVHVLRHAAGGVSEPLDIKECRTNPAIAHYIDGWTPCLLYTSDAADDLTTV